MCVGFKRIVGIILHYIVLQCMLSVDKLGMSYKIVHLIITYTFHGINLARLLFLTPSYLS